MHFICEQNKRKKMYPEKIMLLWNTGVVPESSNPKRPVREGDASDLLDE